MNIKKYFLCFLFLFCQKVLFGQVEYNIFGKISFLSNQNVYVSFEETVNLIPGDTLYQNNGNQRQIALIVESASSKSCITHAYLNQNFVVGQVVYFIDKKVENALNNSSSGKIGGSNTFNQIIEKNNPTVNQTKEHFDARFNVSANGSREEGLANYDRLRSSFNLEYQNINNGRFSWEHYLTFNQRLGASNLVNSFNENFKIYSGSLNMQIGTNSSVSFGRRMNNRMANIGASDGVQAETKKRNMIYGIFLGSRPDVLDYSFNTNLTQFGGFLAFEKDSEKGQTQTSVAIAEQKYYGETDRRFLYFQHSNTKIKNLNFFYSIELDLYQKIDSVKSNALHLTSSYFTIRYRPSIKFNISMSYDNRRNVIYYESYKSFIDQLINQETRQGYRLQLNYRPNNVINTSVSAFYRYQSNKVEPTKNYFASVNINKIPGLGGYAFLNYNWMNTYYFDGGILSVNYMKDLFKGFLSTEINYKKIKYQFFNQDVNNQLNQDIFGSSISIFGKGKTTVMFTYEMTFEPTRKYARYYISVNQRFKNKVKK